MLTLKCGDSKILIKEVADKSIDLILTDPPYNVAEDMILDRLRDYRKRLKKEGWDKDFNPTEWIDEFCRVLKPNGNIFIFTSTCLFGKWYDLLNSRFDSVNLLVWYKTNPVPRIFKTGFLHCIEQIICAWNREHTWNFLGQSQMHNIVIGGICQGSERLDHPTQKPLYLLEHIIRVASNKNDVVFDPFMGVGSTGEAALKLGRRFVGFEISEKYFDIAKKRIERTKSQLRLGFESY
jgi:DNA modification methylase